MRSAVNSLAPSYTLPLALPRSPRSVYGASGDRQQEQGSGAPALGLVAGAVEFAQE